MRCSRPRPATSPRPTGRWRLRWRRAPRRCRSCVQPWVPSAPAPGPVGDGRTRVTAADAAKGLRPPVFYQKVGAFTRSLGLWPAATLTAAMALWRRPNVAGSEPVARSGAVPQRCFDVGRRSQRSRPCDGGLSLKFECLINLFDYTSKDTLFSPRFVHNIIVLASARRCDSGRILGDLRCPTSGQPARLTS